MAPSLSSASETRVLVAYTPTLSTGSKTGLEGKLFHLCNPKTGTNMCCMILDGTLQEIHWVKERYSSWFIGNSVCEDGSVYYATPLDPILMALPILEKARMKKGDDSGKFRALEDMILVDGYPGYLNLVAQLQRSLSSVCEVRESGKTSYYRLDDIKVLAWLSCKVQRISEALQLSKTRSFSDMSKEDLKAYTVGLLGEYLTPSWLRLLCDISSVDLETSKRGRSVGRTEFIPAVLPPVVEKGSGPGSGKPASSKKGPPPPGTQKITSFFARPR